MKREDCLDLTTYCSPPLEICVVHLKIPLPMIVLSSVPLPGRATGTPAAGAGSGLARFFVSSRGSAHTRNLEAAARTISLRRFVLYECRYCDLFKQTNNSLGKSTTVYPINTANHERGNCSARKTKRARATTSTIQARKPCFITHRGASLNPGVDIIAVTRFIINADSGIVEPTINWPSCR